ncbi:SPOR domain-containing protein [Vibrio hannami]|uniref:SPOR domain-containing protein n=1 Tax=Vibrio hannami TaxID=2717094 RepID=UPI003EB79D6C
MASKFQSRLVGTIILVAIGVIVLPDVLDGQKLHYKEEFAAIPIKPEIDNGSETFEVLEPIEVETELPEAPVLAEVTIGEEQSESDTVVVTEKPVPGKNEYQDSAWIIQLMALKNAKNAETLVEDLQKRGFRAFTKNENGFTRVIVGPDVSKVKLERQIKELQKITGSKGQLQKFKPLNP